MPEDATSATEPAKRPKPASATPKKRAAVIGDAAVVQAVADARVDAYLKALDFALAVRSAPSHPRAAD